MIKNIFIIILHYILYIILKRFVIYIEYINICRVKNDELNGKKRKIIAKTVKVNLAKPKTDITLKNL